MKKLIFTLLLTVLLISVSKAQTTNLKITESKEYKDKVKSTDVLAIQTSTNGNTGVIRNSKKDFLFDIFDSEMNKIYSEVVESSKKEAYVGDLFYDNKIKFFTVYAPKKDERIIYCHTLDLNSKKHLKTTIFSTSVEKKQNLFGSRKNHKTSFAISPNGNYFAIATDNIRKHKNSYTIRVFDAKTEKLVYKKAYQEGENLKFKHNDLSIDDNATVYSLGKLFLSGKRQKKFNGDANYDFVLNKITKESVDELKIKLEDFHIQSLSITNLNNKLHLLGFYSEKNITRIKGGCDFAIDTNSFTIENKKSEALPKQVYEDLYGYRTANRKNDKKKELRNFYIDYVLNDSNGNTYLIAEEFYITQTYVQTGTSGGYWRTVYHYDDILILKFDTVGNLAWGRSIFKRSLTPSYNAFIKNNNLHVILNSGKNLKEKKDGRTKASKGFLESTSLYDFEYSASGDVNYNKIQDNKGNAYYLPFYGTYSENKFIVTSSGRKKKQFMILE